MALIKDVHQKSKQRYGSPRIHKVLQAKKVAVYRLRVARLIKQAQLRVRMKRRFKATTDSKHQYAVSENLLNRNFTATATGQVWARGHHLHQDRNWLALPDSGAGPGR